MGLAHSPQMSLNGLVLCLDAANRKSYPTTGTTWTDLSGRGNTGTLVNGVGYNSSDLGSLVFDGVDDYVTLPANSINTNADFTLNFWNKTASTVSSIRTLLGASSGVGHLQVRYDSTSIQLVKNNVVNIGSFAGFTASSSTVYLITITLNKSTNTYSLYVNGSFVSTIVSAQTFATSTPALGTNQTIEVFNSNIYSFSCYNRALTAQEIQQNYNACRSRFMSPISIASDSIVSSGLLLNLDAGNSSSYPGSGTTWTNLVGGGNNGTLTNGPTYNSANGGAIVFDGTNDYVQLTSQSLISVDFSVEVWFYATKAVSSNQILYTSYNLPGGAQASTFILHTQTSKLFINNGNSSISSNLTLSNNTWYHAVATYTASGTTARLYINGTLESTGTFTISSGASSNYIGGSPGDNNIGTWWFGGSIPIVRAYRTKVLSVAEIQQNFNALRSRFSI